MLTEEQKELVLENIGLVGIIVKKYKLLKEYEDFYSIGILGLIKGVKIYDSSKGYKPSTLLSRCIENEIRIELRKRKQDNQKANFNSISLDADMKKIEKPISEIIPDEKIDIEKEIIQKEEIKQLLEQIEILNFKERFVIYHSFGIFGYKQLKQKEIASSLKVSQTYVSTIRTRAIKKIKQNLKETYLL